MNSVISGISIPQESDLATTLKIDNEGSKKAPKAEPSAFTHPCFLTLVVLTGLHIFFAAYFIHAGSGIDGSASLNEAHRKLIVEATK